MLIVVKEEENRSQVLVASSAEYLHFQRVDFKKSVLFKDTLETLKTEFKGEL